MQDLSVYFSPVNIGDFPEEGSYQPSQVGASARIYSAGNGFPDLEGMEMAVLGVEEDRRSIGNAGCGSAADAVREYFYRLYPGANEFRIADLGNIRKGHTVEDSYFAVTSVCHELIRNNIIPVIIGGSQDITYANYLAYKDIEATISITGIDARLDLGDPGSDFTSHSWLGKIILHQPNMLFNYSNLGYQTYFNDDKAIAMFSKLYFDCCRLGQVRSNLEDAEPSIRNADMLTVDISSIRQNDAPASAYRSPNGFYGDEICQLMRYAGMNDKLSSIGFYECNPSRDENGQTAHLLAQMIWCFMDGYCNRKKDFPFRNTSDYTRYSVTIKGHKDEIVFYKSNKSERWWMDVPYPLDKKIKFERHHLVPCSYSDYKLACSEELPDKWWQTYQKLC